MCCGVYSRFDCRLWKNKGSSNNDCSTVLVRSDPVDEITDNRASKNLNHAYFFHCTCLHRAHDVILDPPRLRAVNASHSAMKWK